MEYRIKIIEKNNGVNLFIPQYRKEGWEISLIGLIFISPLMFFLWILVENDKKWNDISEYFNMWNSIEYNFSTHKITPPFFVRTESYPNCDTREEAKYLIKTHIQDREDKLKKEQDENIKIEMNKTKKTSYLKINNHDI